MDAWLSDDLRILHEDMPSEDVIKVAGEIVSGFITRETLEPEEVDGYNRTIIVFRSHIQYDLGTSLLLNDVEYEVAQVDGEEGAWEHRIVEA